MTLEKGSFGQEVDAELCTMFNSVTEVSNSSALTILPLFIAESWWSEAIFTLDLDTLFSLLLPDSICPREEQASYSLCSYNRNNQLVKKYMLAKPNLKQILTTKNKKMCDWPHVNRTTNHSTPLSPTHTHKTAITVNPLPPFDSPPSNIYPLLFATFSSILSFPPCQPLFFVQNPPSFLSSVHRQLLPLPWPAGLALYCFISHLLSSIIPFIM